MLAFYNTSNIGLLIQIITNYNSVITTYLYLNVIVFFFQIYSLICSRSNSSAIFDVKHQIRQVRPSVGMWKHQLMLL